MAEYTGSIELISGIKPKNNGTFPLVNAKDVQMPHGGRLSDIVFSLSDEEKQLLYILFKNADYHSDMSEILTSLATLWGVTASPNILYDVSVLVTEGISYSNDAVTVKQGDPYTSVITFEQGYTLTSIAITMWGEDITGTVYSDGTINIPSVTGNVLIKIAAKYGTSALGEAMLDTMILE